MEAELPKRKPIRLENFHYSAGYAYFITICTENRAKILSEIVGEGFSLPQLTAFGEIVNKNILHIPQKYENASVKSYVIMPNHIHLIISIVDDGREDPSPTINSIIGWLKYQSTKEYCPNSKSKLFQRSFYDHVIRGREDYEEISRYIYENPENWEKDELY